MWSAWVMMLGVLVMPGHAAQGIPEENDGQCLLSRKRVSRPPLKDMLAGSVTSGSRKHAAVLQQHAAKASDPLDHIAWDQQLRDYKMVADDVAPAVSTDRCPLQRIDAQKASKAEVKHLDKPVIFTNVFDPEEDWPSDLSKEELMDRYGDVELYDGAFDHLGAGSFLRDHVGDVQTVEDATKAKQPGNLIFFEDEVSNKMVTKILDFVKSKIPEESRDVVLPE
ncbi:Spag6, partial [Symbiodinium pilosum]